MPSPACNVYGLFISCIASLLLGIGTLVVNILFKYIGFVDSDVAIGLCTESYFMEKYWFLQLQLQTAFVGICLNILMNCIVLGMLIVTLKKLKSADVNPKLKSQTLPESVISKSKIITIYIFTSFGGLGSIVCFGNYLSLYFAALKDPSTCSFTYIDSNLFILMIIAGVWVLGMIVQLVFSLVVNNYVAQEDAKEQRQNKYKQMINVTEQPEVPNQYGYGKHQDNMILKGAEFTQQPSNGELHSFGNQKQFASKTYHSKQPQNDKYAKKSQPYILKDMQSSQVLKPNNDTPTNFGGISNEQRNPFGSFAEEHLNNDLMTKDQFKKGKINDKIIPERFYSRQIEQPEKKVISNVPIININHENPNTNTNLSQYNNIKNKNPNINTNSSQYSSGGSLAKSPGKFYNSANNAYSQSNQPEEQMRSIRNRPYQNQPEYNNPFSKPLSPIKQLNESVLNHQGSYTPSPAKDDPFKNVQMLTAQVKGQPQKLLNTANGRQGYRPNLQEVDQDTNGQLMFHMKAIEQEKDKPRQVPEIYKNDIQRSDKNSSGQVSFKSPSRFDSKFVQQQNKYLSRNTLNSILPAMNKIKEPSDSRKNGLNDKYSSGANSYFAQSRGLSDSPGSKFSRTKAREGVLTSFIRGKFA